MEVTECAVKYIAFSGGQDFRHVDQVRMTFSEQAP